MYKVTKRLESIGSMERKELINSVAANHIQLLRKLPKLAEIDSDSTNNGTLRCITSNAVSVR